MFFCYSVILLNIFDLNKIVYFDVICFMLQFLLVYRLLSLYVKQKLSQFPCVFNGRHEIVQGQSDMSKLWGGKC